jgi:hypothetical protein
VLFLRPSEFISLFKTSNVCSFAHCYVCMLPHRAWTQGKVMKMPSAASIEPPNKTVGANPFASTVLTTSTDTASRNPFASVSFAQTPKQSTSNRPPIATSTKKNPIDKTLPTSISPNPMKNLRPGAAEKESIPLDERAKLLLAFAFKGNQEGRVNPISDYSSWMKEMVKKSNSLQGKSSTKGSESKKEVGELSAAPMFTFGNANNTITSTNSVQSTKDISSQTPTFSFGNNALKTSVTNDGISKPSQGFTFGSSSTTSAAVTEPKPFTGFSFSAPIASTNVTAPAPAASTTHQDDDEDGQLLDEPEEVLAATNDDDDELGCFEPIKFTRFDKTKNAYTSWISGVLRLYRTKSNQKYKLVVRTKQVGKVMLNLEVYKGMVFKKEDIPKKNNIKQVAFMAVKDPDVGLEKFTIKIAATEVDSFLEKLEEMAK